MVSGEYLTTPPSTDGHRIEYLDALRGLTMILVVYSHVANTIFKADCPTNDFFIIFRMPLFFFISGFLTFGDYSRSLMIRRSKNRVLMQFLPTAVMFTLFVLIFHLPFHRLLFDTTKGGYWFTLVVVECFFLYMLFTAIFKVAHVRKHVQAIAYLALMVGAYITWRVLTPTKFFRGDIPELISLQSLCLYLPYFFSGLLARMYWTQFCRFIANGWAVTILLSAFIAMFWFDVWETAVILQRMIGMILVFRIFQFYSHTFSHHTKTGRTLSFIGKYTLEIYLLHYFFVRSLRLMRFHADLGWVNSSWMVQLLVFMAISLFIIGLCLLTARAFRIAPPAYRLCFGKYK